MADPISEPTHSEASRRLVFLVCGTVTALTGTAVWYLSYWLTENEDLSLVLDYVWGTLLGFQLNRRFTFGDRTTAAARSFGRYCLTAVGYFSLHWLLMKPLLILGLGVPIQPAFWVSFAAALVLFYWIQKVWVFRQEPA